MNHGHPCSCVFGTTPVPLSIDPVQVPEKRFTLASRSQNQTRDSVYRIWTVGRNKMSCPSFRPIEKLTEHITIMKISTELAVRLKGT
jgi:hypothetical protein